jgi:hypothetical protein
MYVTSNSTYALIKMMRDTDGSYQISCLLLICTILLRFVMSLRNYLSIVERSFMFRKNDVMGICTSNVPTPAPFSFSIFTPFSLMISPISKRFWMLMMVVVNGY